MEIDNSFAKEHIDRWTKAWDASLIGPLEVPPSRMSLLFLTSCGACKAHLMSFRRRS